MTKLIIFDLDGTLINTIEDLGTAVNYAMERCGYPLHTMDEYAAMVGNGVRMLVTRALPEHLKGDRSVIDTALPIFERYYTEHIDVYTKPYDGMPELLAHLKQAGIKIAVATNKFQEGADNIIAKVFPAIRFDAIYGNRPGVPLKPDASVIHQILETTGVEAADALYIGDTEVDMATAVNGGVRSVGVTWGYRDRSNLGAADTIVDTIDALEGLIFDR